MAVGLGFLGIVLTVLLVLTFGDPHWHKLFFLWQKHVCHMLPRMELREEYYGNGQKATEAYYVGGYRHGRYRAWLTTGELIADGEYRDDQPWEGVLLFFAGDRFLRVRYHAGERGVVEEPLGGIETDFSGWKSDLP